MKMYGPYKNNSNRLFVVLYDEETRQKKTQSYPRWLYEQHYGITLPKNIQIDHIDGDHLNNDISNLQILSQDENIKKYLESSKWKNDKKTQKIVCGTDEHKEKLSQNSLGIKNGMAKLTESDVIKIRNDPRSSIKVARDYGVSDGLIRMIRRREIWSHI